MSGAAIAQMQQISMNSPQSPSFSSPTSKPPSRKRQLTQAEKFSIQKFHQDNPFVTHHHIAGLFGLERSTVSKIIGQAPIQPNPQTPSQEVGSITLPSQHNTPDVGIIQQQTPPSKVQRALLQWAQQTQRNGIRVTQPMLRREAAKLAAIAWTERPPFNPSAQLLSVQQSAFSGQQSISSNTSWDNAWNPPVLPYSTAVLPVSPSNSLWWDSPSSPTTPGPASFPDISMDDVLSATSPAQMTSFDDTFFDNVEPLAPSVEDARGALDVLQDHMKQGDQLSPFDYLCFEHLRERLMASKVQFY
ncbi:hypothetical protein G7Y79_00004g014530 [Physcia stellaris]|nr:hypothetical protein G7Y79_00004g014530 [Physcia stellaris]